MLVLLALLGPLLNGATRAAADSAVPGGLCRFGVGTTPTIATYPVSPLRLGWYLDWGASPQPPRPDGMAYTPMVRFRQTGPATYSASLRGPTLATAVAGNPAALWLLGNEPDRRYWQDDLEPQVYARAYHDLYDQIKALDPAAQIAAGGIVAPTPLRLQYLDRVLAAYRELYGAPMPVDVWNIHAFILQERSCRAYPADCWGADIPPGIDADEGRLYTIQDNANLAIFAQLVLDFRSWMAARGYGGLPLIISEFGVQMPLDYIPAERVKAFMQGSFDYLASAAGPLGDPADGHRLVQRWAWYSLDDTAINGWLFDPTTRARSVYGDYYAAYTAQVVPQVNLTAVRAWAEPAVTVDGTRPVTVRLHAQVASNGNVAAPRPVTVRFYAGDPAHGGIPIGQDQALPALGGCGTTATASLEWQDVAPGTYAFYAVVDPQDAISESTRADNTASGLVLVGAQQFWLPVVAK